MIPILACATAGLCAFITHLPRFADVKAQRHAMPIAQELLLQQDCEAMNAEGKILELIEELNQNADELAEIRISRIENRDDARVQQIQGNIRRITTQAKNILRPEWTEVRWPYRVAWNLRFTDVMKTDPKIIESNFKFDDFVLEGIKFGGMEREDLYPLVNVTVEAQRLRVEIEKTASSLELCQLHSTWEITGQVRYDLQRRRLKTRSELTLRPGATRPPPLPKPVKRELPSLRPPLPRFRDPTEAVRACKDLGLCPVRERLVP